MGLNEIWCEIWDLISLAEESAVSRKVWGLLKVTEDAGLSSYLTE
jgi:hypothetical protein